MRVVADRDTCIASGMCMLAAPRLFEQDEEDGRVILLTESIEPSDADAVLKAVAHCPSGALSLLGE
jgi:ferredoxin